MHGMAKYLRNLSSAVALLAMIGCGSSEPSGGSKLAVTTAPPTSGAASAPVTADSDAGAALFGDAGACGTDDDQAGCACTAGAAPRSCTPSGGAGCGSAGMGTQSCDVSQQAGELTGGTWGECQCPCVAGSQTLTTAGATTFSVPTYVSLTVQLWGGGGGGAAYLPANMSSAGGDSSFNQTVVAGGGQSGTTGKGGTASGGTINTPGTDATGIAGGDAPDDGGAGGSVSTLLDSCADVLYGSPAGDGQDGSAPGGGGQGDVTCQLDWLQAMGWGEYGTGGGSGGYVSVTYAAGQLAPGSTVPVVVGAGGAGSEGAPSSEAPFTQGTPKNAGYYTAGDGAPGQVTIAWTCQ